MSRGLVPFTVPNERSALQAGNVGGNADSFRPMAEHGSGGFFIIRGQVSYRYLQAGVTQASADRCHTGIFRQALRRHLQAVVVQVFTCRCCASICSKALRRYCR
jgi:hypothetical protein